MFDALRRRLPRLGRWTRVALAAACGLLALDSAVTAHGAQRGRAPAGVAVVVAARDLPAGRSLAVGDLSVSRWPPSLVPASAVRRMQPLIGRRLAAGLARHEALTTTRLLGRDLTTGLGPGLVAVPVPIADPHAADLLHPGDHIDLLATPRAEAALPDDATQATASTVTIAGTRLLVLAVFPAADDTGTEVVVAADRASAVRIARIGVSQTLAGVGVPP